MTVSKSANFFIKLSLLFLSSIAFNFNMEAQQKAFPSAYGGGAYATGGRGGHVYHVTRLDDSSTKGAPTKGTFRWAVTQPRPATVVFDVSGTIVLDKSLYIEDDNITIAGQSAPKGGITLTTSNDQAQIKFTWGRHRIMSYIRIRPMASENDAFEIYSGRKLESYGDNTIFDHMSISYGGDEAFSIRGEETRNITFQRGLLAESTKGSLFGDINDAKNGKHSYDNSFLTTLFVNISHRTPNISGNGRFDVINNVIYDWKYRLSLIRSGAEVNNINNFYFMGNKGTYAYTYKDNPTKYSLNVAIDNMGDLKIYAKGNIIQDGFTDPNASNEIFWAWWDRGLQTRLMPKSQFTNTMMPLVGAELPIMKALQASTEVPENAGANKYLNADGTFGIYRDANDTEYLSIVQNDRPEPYEILTSGKNKGRHSFVNGKRYANFLASVSTTPIGTRPKNFYVSNPHIPEAFFKAHVPAGQNHNDKAPSGYTWLEEYLHGVYRTNNLITAESIEVSPNKAEVQIHKKVQLKKTFIPQNTTNQKGVWFSTNDKIAKVDANGLVTAIAAGEATIIFKSDGGHQGRSEITVFKEAFQASAGSDQQICQGSSTTLTATGGSSYLWSTGAKTASIEVSPNQTTTYSVTVFDSTGKNSVKEQVRVTVNTTPPSVDAGENVTINAGEEVTLTAKGANSYKWSNGATTASIKVSPASTTEYTVTGIKDGCEAIDIVKVMIRNAVSSGVKADAGLDKFICQGTSTTLTATGGSSYLWNTGAKTASIEVSPNETTTYSVTAYDSSGRNSDKDQVRVTVNTTPPSVDAGENVTINPGEEVTLTAKGANSYKWSNGATTASIRVSPNSTTEYMVIGTKDGCEAIDIVKVMVRKTSPAQAKAYAGEDQNVCEGSNITLTATGGDTYLWSTGAKTPSINVNPASTTKYSVIAYVDGTSDEDEVTINVNDNPNVRIINGSNANILEGEFITLSAKGANTYKWSNGATEPNIAVSPKKTKSFDVTGYINDCSDQKSITINVYDKVVANAGNDVTICIDENTVLTAEGPANGQYLWSTGEITKSITVAPKENTEYSVMVYHALDSDTDKVMVKVESCKNPQQITEESIEITEESKELEFLIYPNPTDGEVNIKISGLTSLSSIHLYDLSGKSLYNDIINDGNKQTYVKTLNISDYASGIYMLQLVDNQRVITKKIVLK